MALSFLGTLRHIPTNKLNFGVITGEFDNAWDVGNNLLSSTQDEADVFAPATKSNKANPVAFFGDFLAAFAGGEMIKEVDSVAGLAGSVAKSVLNPLDAITDLGSGMMVITRAAANGELGVGTFFEAAQYIGSSIPVLGAAVDIAKFKKVYDKMSATGKQIQNLNKGLGSALDAAKANKTGNILKFDDIKDISKFKNSADWKNLKDVKVSVKTGDKVQDMNFADALKQYRNGNPAEQLELEKTLKTAVENYNVGAGKGSVFNNIETAEVIQNHDDFVNWKDIRNNKVNVDGTQKSFDNLIKSNDPNDLAKANEALTKYNKANGSDLNVDKLKSMKNNHDEWIEMERDLTPLKIQTNNAPGEVITFNQFGAKTTQKKIEFKEQANELTTEAMKVVDEYKEKFGKVMHGTGKATRSIKEM